MTEQLLHVRKNAIATRAFIRKNLKKENTKVNLLPNKRLMELFKQIKEGDINAMETLSIKYIQLIINVSEDFKGDGLTDLELILKGNSGLIKAAENFDESRGIDFHDYAAWSVRQAIIQAIDEKEFIKPLPLNKIGLLTNKKYWHQNPQERTGQLLKDI
jgi:DNA-directed RNA polymerase sigma subunit (sigma70/sigma32)